MVWVLVLVAAIIPTMALGTPISANKLSQDQDIIAFFSGVCTMHSSQAKIPEVMNTIDKVQTCSASITNDMDKIKYSEVTRDEEYDEIIKKYCAPNPELRNCTYSLLNIITWCGDKDDRRDVENARIVMDYFIDYACYKEGERLADFVRAGGLQCVEKNSKSLRQCGSFIADMIQKDDDEDNSEENDVCEVLEHIVNCVLSSMSGCGVSAVKIAKNLGDHLREVVNCKDSQDLGMQIYQQWLQSLPK